MALALPHMVGEYKLLNHIDDGTFGVVYRAHILNSPNKIVAVKWSHPDAFVYPRGSSLSAEVLRRSFRRERDNTLIHRYANQIIDYGEEGGWPYLASEYRPNHLGELLSSHGGRLPFDLALRIIRQLLEVIAVAHGKDIVHRDLKPTNVLLTKDSTVKVSDFGLSRALDDVPANQRSTLRGMGTPPYPPQEQRGLTTPAHPTMDVYALGVIGFEVLTGEAPYGSKDEFERWMQAGNTGEYPNIQD